MKRQPPRLINRFLEWYCRADRLDEIQGDAFELYHRTAEKSKWKADLQFTLNVIRFFRWRNIRASRLSRSTHTTDMLFNIFKVALRNFMRQPGHALLHIAGLSVSFTAAFLIGLWVYFEFSFDRFHGDYARIWEIKSHVDASGTIETYSAARVNINLAAMPEVESKTVVVSGNRWPNELCFRQEGREDACIYLKGIYAERPFFTMFHFPIVEGDRDPLSKSRQIAISRNMAHRLYGNGVALGKTIKLDNHFPVTVASIFEDVPGNSSLQFEFVLPWEVFAELRGMKAEDFSREFLPSYFKTNKDVTAAELTAKLNQPSILTEDLRNDKLSYSAFALQDARLNGTFKDGRSVGGRIQYVQMFTLVALLVVAMAVVNFIHLTTARSADRAKEIGIRKVIGAHRGSIALQFVGEAFLVITLSVVLASIATQLLLPAFSLLTGEPLTFSLLDTRILPWVAIFLLVVALFAGLYPAFVMSSFQPVRVLKGQLTEGRSGSMALRKALLAIQVGISVGIVIFTGVLFQQLKFIAYKDLGVDKENIIHIEPSYPLLKQYDVFKNELLSHPNIQSVTATAADPVNLNATTTGVRWPGMPPGMNAPFNLLGTNHEVNEVFGMKLLQGRFFSERPVDTLHQEVVVTQSAAQRMGLKDPLGTVIHIGEAECSIIGVIKDFHSASLKQEQLPVILYRHSILQCSRLYIRYSGPADEAITTVTSAYNKSEPNFTIRYDFVDDTFNEMYKTENTASSMLVIFTILSVVIAIVGVVGMATLHVMKRKKEISIKRVFGASEWQMLFMLSREFLVVLLVSVVVAVPLAWFSAETWLSGYAYRIVMPWWIFAGAVTGIALLTLSLIAAQGIRTIRLNPGETLRGE